MKLRIGISPCPNDTFIFESLYDGSIKIPGIDLEFFFEDVQTLNEIASKQGADIVKISYAHYFSVIETYVMLRSGGAMGKGVGPLLVALPGTSPEEISASSIAIPGKHTTANFLLKFYLPGFTDTLEMSFEKIEDAVLERKCKAGVLIHENRFTYAERGLYCIQDLGEIWEAKTSLPIPLGGIAVRRSLDFKLQSALNKGIRESIARAGKKNDLSEFIVSHAQSMSADVMKQHIGLYVNEYSLDIGIPGREAVARMKEILKPETGLPVFYNQ